MQAVQPGSWRSARSPVSVTLESRQGNKDSSCKSVIHNTLNDQGGVLHHSFISGAYSVHNPAPVAVLLHRYAPRAAAAADSV